MSGRGHFSKKCRAEGGGLFCDGTTSLFDAAQGHAAVQPFVPERFEITSRDASHTRGSKSTFEVDRRADLWGGVYLEFDRAAGTDNSSTGTSPYAVDWEGYHSIDFVEVRYKNRRIWSMTGRQMVDEILEEETDEMRTALAEMGGGMLSVNDRQLKFLNSQNFGVRIPVPWGKHHSKYMPLIGVPNKIEIVVHWAPESAVLHQVKGGGTASTIGGIANPVMVCDMIHVLKVEQEKYWSKIHRGEGWQIKSALIESHTDEYFKITDGTNGTDSRMRLKLVNIRNDTYRIRVKLRYQDYVNVADYLDYNSYLPMRTVELHDNGAKIMTTQNYRLGTRAQTAAAAGRNIWHDNVKMFPNATPGLPWANIAFTLSNLVLASEHDAFGSAQMHLYNNPELNVYINNDYASVSPLPVIAETPASGSRATADLQSFVLDVDGFSHQIIQIVNGDLVVAFQP